MILKEYIYVILILVSFHWFLPSTLANDCDLKVLSTKGIANVGFMVNMLLDSNAGELKCTGFILNNFWILAPASCLSDHKASRYRIRLSNGQIKEVKQIIINEDYNNEQGPGFDLALVQSNSDLITIDTCSISFIEIQSINEINMDQCLLIKRNQADKYTINNIKYNRINDLECLGRFDSTIDDNLPNLTECFGDQKVGVCRGETGALVMCPKDSLQTNKQYYPIALSSWGDLICTEHHYEHPHIFTKLNYVKYRNWIDITTGMN